jgi:hypothetical protein
MTANITIETAERKTLVLPTSAIQREGEVRFVFVLKDGKEEKRVVAIGARDGTFTEIKKGLTASDKVIANRAAGAEKKDGRQ